MKKRIFLTILIIFLSFLLLPMVYSKTAASVNDIAVIKPIFKVKPPIFEIQPPIVDEECFGFVCLSPGETSESLGLNVLSNNSLRTLETTTVENKWNTAPTTGTYDIPVLLVKFPDMTAPSNYNVSMYDDVFNSSNYLSGNGISVKEYYKKNSYDQLNITYDVYDWRMMPNNYSYYYTNNNVHQLVVDAMNAFGTGSNAIDFTQYDSDNDGRIDGVVLLHAGFPAQEQSGNIASQARLYRGVTNYSIQGKLYGNVAVIPSRHTLTGVCNNWMQTFNYPTDCRTSITVAVHEYAHVIGLPDLYAITYSGQQAGTGLGGHTIMNMDSDATQDVKKPINFDSWSKFFFGWLSPTVISSASQANIYSLSSYDTTNDAYILHNPDTMDEKEFFIITNRYISTTSLDRYLFGTTTPPFNVNGGIDILHIDENYIDYTYAGPLAFNSVMYDPDGDYYDDTVSHPGIVFEQNRLDQALMRHFSDVYTSEVYTFNPNCNPIVNVGKFDNISRIDANPNCGVTRDTTSTTYTDLSDSGIRVYGWSVGGTTMQAYLTVDEPLDLEAEITSPENNSTYGINDSISFSSSIENEIGDASCLWQHKKSGTSSYVTFSNQCNTTRTPESLNLTEGTYTIKLKVEDDFEREVTDTVTINIVVSTTLYNEITSPIENHGYPFKEPVTFNAEYYNNQGDVSCEWRYNGVVFSNECNFTDTPYNLGLASPPYNSMVVLNSSIPSFTTLNKPLQTSPLFKEPLKVSSPTIKSPTYIGNFPAGFTRTITLTTTDASDASFVSSVEMKICLCLLANNNAALPY